MCMQARTVDHDVAAAITRSVSLPAKFLQFLLTTFSRSSVVLYFV